MKQVSASRAAWRVLTAAAALLLAASGAVFAAADYSGLTDKATFEELDRIADFEMGLMVPMRDGVRLATNVYRPKGVDGPLPVILEKTPYNQLAYSASTTRSLMYWVSRGYAYVLQNERGRYFSEGEYEILGRPQSDGYDTLSWIAAQPWSNGRVGTLGCSSSAEWQLALAAQDHPAHAAMVPMAAGAGIGKVGRFQEQGNWYTGGVPRNLFMAWLYWVDNPLRAQVSGDMDPETRARIMRYNDLDAKKPPVEWARHMHHLPVAEMLSALDEPPGTFEQLIARTPADPAWRSGGLYHDDMGWGVPALWFNSWYDVSIGPNMELFNHARAVGGGQAGQNQYVVVGPNNHCAFDSLGKDFRSGDRELGDASLDTKALIESWFDRWLKDQPRAFPRDTPHVQYFNMGENRWRSAGTWPPAGTETVRMYLRSEGRANSLFGDGRLEAAAPVAGESSDRFQHDPANPVPTIGGGDCCNGGVVVPGAFDQRPVAARNDVLVYTSAPLAEPLQVTGFVDAVLKVSSSAPDTDFAVKLVDVAPDGTAYILGDTIIRARYRNGFEQPVLLEPGEVATVQPSPITISNTFQPGHRIRIEIASSNFPKFARNLNTGGRNEFESEWEVAENAVHHDAQNASYIDFPVVR